MKNKVIYIILFAGLLLTILLLTGDKLTRNREEQSTDMRTSTFSNIDKKAGGAYVAFKLLPQLFSNHSVQVVTKPFAQTYLKEKELRSSGNVYILVAGELFTTKKDITAMLEYVSNGNELFIAMNMLDPLLAKRLKLTTVDGISHHQQDVKFVQHYFDKEVPVDTSFDYKGMISSSYFSQFDTCSTTTLGYNYQHKPNFICVAYNRGYIYILLNPYTFTNYFLLYQNNVAALETQLSYLQYDAGNVYWDDFYNRQHSVQSGNFSEWQVLMRYPAMRWAVWLSLALALLYVLFESKRRQRIIPEKPVVDNTTLEFVDAIGQLYFQQHNNYNLANKMILHLLAYIRTRYYLNINSLNDELAAALAKKSAIPVSGIRELLQMIHDVQLEENITDDYLQEFYKRIQLFYLNTQ